MSLVSDQYEVEEEVAVAEEEEEVPNGGQIDLDCGPFVVAVNRWRDLATAQTEDAEAQLTPADFAAKAGEREVFAFCYKQEILDPWLQIFVVRDGEQVHLFDEAGDDVVDESAPAGRQELVVAGKSTGFLDEWSNGFYSNALTVLASKMPGAGPAEDEAEPHSADEEAERRGSEVEDEGPGACSAPMIPSTWPQ